MRSKAVTMGEVADIMQAREQLDEALRIRLEEELPVYERLGDVRSKAVTMGQVADILQARGQLNEAVRIRQEEELPVYEQLGDVRSKAITQWQIALAMLESADPKREHACLLLTEAHEALKAMGLPEADTLAAQMTALGLAPPA